MPPYPTTILKAGDHGEAVRQLQMLLNRDYPAYSHLTEDGAFGPKTEAVIREFQHRAGLPITGIADYQTLAKLDELTVQGGGGDKYCGNDVYAGPSTSCEFALNVREAYFMNGGDSTEVEAYSPVTGQTYLMACVRNGHNVTCRGGNNAVVRFSFG
jgi:peptidoglycan hydrolase-like protein with peptidoglycan-binding domain